MTRIAHIAMVDDEADIREMVGEYLGRHGYAVTALGHGQALLDLLVEQPVDLAILDVNLPGMDGVSLARKLVARGPIGIIMLTAQAGTVDRVVGLEVGADDYVTKPFDLRELLARVRSVLRRAAAPTLPSAPSREVRFGRCRLDLEERRLYDAQGGEVPITAMEFDLLNVFARNPNRVLSRERLLDLAHGKGMEAFDRSIDTRIARLRAKIEPDPALPQAIKTVRGAGYRFVTEG